MKIGIAALAAISLGSAAFAGTTDNPFGKDSAVRALRRLPWSLHRGDERVDRSGGGSLSFTERIDVALIDVPLLCAGHGWLLRPRVARMTAVAWLPLEGPSLRKMIAPAFNCWPSSSSGAAL